MCYVVHRVWVYVLRCTPNVGVCVVLYTRGRCMCCVVHCVCVVLYILYVYVLYSVMGHACMGLSRPCCCYCGLC